MHDDTWRGAGRAALSVAGGAALTVLWAGTAGAGDAEAVGNASDTSGSQTLVVTPDAGPTVADLDGAVVNGGASAANTGVNGAEEVDVTTGHARASGNESQSQLDQSARSSGTGHGLTVIDQSAGIRNLGAAAADTGFNDGAAVHTGDASAWGNRSWTSVVQQAVVEDASAAVRFLRQAAEVDNLGAALANTGLNEAAGDDSTNLPEE